MDSGRSGHAIVPGAGMAARAPAEHYQSVTVLERDTVAGPAQRRGVPQGRHLHGLMAGDRAIIEALFPGLTAEAVGRGAPVTEVLVASRWCLSGLRACPGPTGQTTLLASRPLLESLIRERVTALPGVAPRAGAAADGPLAAPGMITGVRMRSAGGGDGAELAADLVVDATGGASRTAQWPAGAARPAPVTERVDVDLGYSSRTCRHRPAHLGGDLGVVVSTMPGRRGGAIRVEGDRWHVTLGGMLGNHPATDHAGFPSPGRHAPGAGNPPAGRGGRTAGRSGAAPVHRVAAALLRAAGRPPVPRCHVAASADPDVARTFLRVANLVEPASVLLRPGTVTRMLRQSAWPTTTLAGKGNGDAKHRTRRGSADTRPGRVPADESGQQ